MASTHFVASAVAAVALSQCHCLVASPAPVVHAVQIGVRMDNFFNLEPKKKLKVRGQTNLLQAMQQGQQHQVHGFGNMTNLFGQQQYDQNDVFFNDIMDNMDEEQQQDQLQQDQFHQYQPQQNKFQQYPAQQDQQSELEVNNQSSDRDINTDSDENEQTESEQLQLQQNDRLQQDDQQVQQPQQNVQVSRTSYIDFPMTDPKLEPHSSKNLKLNQKDDSSVSVLGEFNVEKLRSYMAKEPTWWLRSLASLLRNEAVLEQLQEEGYLGQAQKIEQLSLQDQLVEKFNKGVWVGGGKDESGFEGLEMALVHAENSKWPQNYWSAKVFFIDGDQSENNMSTGPKVLYIDHIKNRSWEENEGAEEEGDGDDGDLHGHPFTGLETMTQILLLGRTAREVFSHETVPRLGLQNEVSGVVPLTPEQEQRYFRSDEPVEREVELVNLIGGDYGDDQDFGLAWRTLQNNFKRAAEEKIKSMSMNQNGIENENVITVEAMNEMLDSLDFSFGFYGPLGFSVMEGEELAASEPLVPHPKTKDVKNKIRKSVLEQFEKSCGIDEKNDDGAVASCFRSLFKVDAESHIRLVRAAFQAIHGSVEKDPHFFMKNEEKAMLPLLRKLLDVKILKLA